MSAKVEVILGPAGSGKTNLLLSGYRRALEDGSRGTVLWLSPSQRGAMQVRDRLLTEDLAACFSPGVMTFAQFAEAVLAVADTPVTPISSLMKRLLLRRLIEQAAAQKRLTHFQPIAGTSGLVELICQFVSELKRLEIWPEHFRAACRQRGLEQKDRELLEIYENYQHLLTRHHLYDAEGRFWSARALLRDGQRRPFDRLRLVAVDGFTDFTRTQHEILQILAQRVEQLVITLPWEEETGRCELFTKPQQTLDRLRSRHPQLETQVLSRQQRADWPAMSHIEAELFTNPRRVRPAPHTTGIKIIAAAGPLGELRQIARTIKQLLAEGDPADGGRRVGPGDIAVVYRSLSEAAPLVREVFGQFGLPFALEAGLPLNQSPPLKALVALLQLDQKDWPYRQLLAVLGNNYFHPNWPSWHQAGAAVAVERTIRDLQIAFGCAPLLEQVERWGRREAAEPSQAEVDPDWIQRHNDRRRRAQLALPVLQGLRQAIARLPKRASAGQWCGAIHALADETGLLAAMSPAGDAPARDESENDDTRLQREAWDRVLAVLGSYDRLNRRLDNTAEQFDRGEILKLLLNILGTEQLPAGGSETGRVRVLEAATARTLRVDYLFFAGLSEQAFPRLGRDDRLYSEIETRRLVDAGLPLVLHPERSAEEMLLFYEVLTRATRRLTLSYSALGEKAQPLLPSPYLSEVERVCGVGTISRQEATDLSPLPPPGTPPQSAEDYRTAAVDAALQGDVHLLAGLSQSESASRVAQNIKAGLLSTQQRRGRRFGPFEGILAGEKARQLIADRFGPDRGWSPSRLEQYALCPHQFFLERVLRLEPLGELKLEIDYLSRGLRLHDALAQLHQLVNRRHQQAASPGQDDESQYRQLAEQVLAEASRKADRDHPLAAALAEIDLRLLEDWLRVYYQQHRDYDAKSEQFEAPPVPTYFEVSFGLARHPADGVSTATPLELARGEMLVKITGRIDRVDVGRLAGCTVFNVLDYKSGNSRGYSSRAVQDTKALQLTLYAMAVEQLLLADQRALPWKIGYWFIAEKGFCEALALYQQENNGLKPSEAWQSLKPRIVAKVFSLVQALRDGQFPMASTDDKCTGRCYFHTTCRVNHVRALEKLWEPPPIPPT